MLNNIILTDSSGNRWEVEQAVSEKAALNEIAFARVTGSVGSSSIVREVDGTERVLAIVHRLNEDGSRRQPS